MPSQRVAHLERDGFSEYAIANSRVQTGFGHDIDPATEQFLNVQHEAGQGECASPGFEADQQVDIARIAGIATAHRPKHTNVEQTPLASEGEQFLTV